MYSCLFSHCIAADNQEFTDSVYCYRRRVLSSAKEWLHTSFYLCKDWLNVTSIGNDSWVAKHCPTISYSIRQWVNESKRQSVNQSVSQFISESTLWKTRSWSLKFAEDLIKYSRGRDKRGLQGGSRRHEWNRGVEKDKFLWGWVLGATYFGVWVGLGLWI